MYAELSHNFAGSFLLDEERLRKIRSMIEVRLSKHAEPPELIYRVGFGDSYIKTSSVDEVIQSDNSNWRIITSLSIDSSRNDWNFSFKLLFSKNGASLQVSGQDRDEVFLLFSDLRDFIQNDVITRHLNLSLSSLLNVVITTLAFGSLAIALIPRSSSLSPDAQAALNSGDIHEKLNFLITASRPITHSLGPSRNFTILLVVVLVLGSGVFAFQHYFNEGNLFSFGKQKLQIESKAKLKSNILWILIAGLIVSVLAGLIVWFFTSSF